MFLDVKNYIQCFNSGMILKDQEATDNPWNEHALFSPDCTIVLLNEGIEIINKVLIEAIDIYIGYYFNQNTKSMIKCNWDQAKVYFE